MAWQTILSAMLAWLCGRIAGAEPKGPAPAIGKVRRLVLRDQHRVELGRLPLVLLFETAQDFVAAADAVIHRLLHRLLAGPDLAQFGFQGDADVLEIAEPRHAGSGRRVIAAP